ncbi:polysaccharide deacetylase family protein [Paraburkholderia rhynchosiae]|uniref:polysaccharide deacetylase family protein n=1 Tax=Paraburkholderia rhynchosiae TaxID=487049 RepID=UPI001FCA3E2F|nr:polysaccharide deacetylase family protein [Paraburkholderia rhynchosiae]
MKVLDCASEARDECHDRAGRRDVYLTFDDGPNPLCTPDVLDVLAEHRVPATFCVIGAYVEDQPKLIQRMIAEGHEIATHTMTHPDLSRCEPDEVRREILDANRIIRMACAQATVRHIRAPYGTWTDEVVAEAAKAGLAALDWSVDPWRQTSLARRRCDCQRGAGLCPDWRNCALAQRTSSRRVRTVLSCWAARPDAHGAFPPDSSTA